VTISAVIRIARTAAPFRAGIAAVGLMLAGAAHGGVTTDGTLGRAGALTGPDYRITPDLGQQAGGNLFHSFERPKLGQCDHRTGHRRRSVAD